MSDAIYPAAKQAFLQAEIDWVNDPVVALLVGTNSYTYSPFHASLADVPATARVALSGTLANRTATYGVADADPITFLSVFGDLANAVILVKYTGTDIASPLLAYLDDGVNLPVNPDGGNITVNWSNGASKIFKI